MRNSDHRLAEHTRSTSQTKRKRFDYEERFRHKNHTKRQKSVAEAKTLTLKPPKADPNSSKSNRFQPIYSSSSRRRNKKHHCNKNSSSVGWNRKWVFSVRDFSSHKDKVIVVSYNILGVENALKHPELYFKVPPEFLKWDRRKVLIRKEINNYNADIICFQEVDRFNDLDDMLWKDGFRGIYKARTGEACDGCAIFWKDKLFDLLHEESIEFQSFSLRNNVAQLCVLKMSNDQSESDLCMQASKTRPQSQRLVVGNIHVLFNPNRGDIKLGQVRLFLETAYKLSKEWGDIPAIIGGDLNSLPQSAMYQFLASSELDILLHDRRNISGQLEHPQRPKNIRSQDETLTSSYMSISRPLMYKWSDEELMLASGRKGVAHLQHQLKLFSAYLGAPGSHGSRDNCGEPLATSYHSKFMGTVDYIWHTEELVPVRVLDTLPIDILRSAGLPNERWGSDHLALVCELAFTNDCS